MSGRDARLSRNNGREITEYNTIKDYLNTRGQTKNESHYFYIIRTPESGLLKGRIKIGKSSNLNARFKSYQDHYYNENIKILKLRQFQNRTTERYGDKGEKLYGLFERNMKKLLKPLSEVFNDTGARLQTEWYNRDKEKDLINIYNNYVKGDITSGTELTVKREKNVRGLDTVNYKDFNTSEVIGREARLSRKDKKVKPKVKEDDTIYEIEKIIRRKGKNSLVKWKGYSDKENSWIPSNTIMDK